MADQDLVAQSPKRDAPEKGFLQRAARPISKGGKNPENHGFLIFEMRFFFFKLHSSNPRTTYLLVSIYGKKPVIPCYSLF